jgi:hypothetical protein
MLFLPQVTLNKFFISELIKAENGSGAIGILETHGEKKGFIAIKPENPIPDSYTQKGINLGQQLLGKSNEKSIIRFSVEIYDYTQYHLLLNPNNSLVRKVLKLMDEANDIFYFIFNGSGLLTFRDDLSGLTKEQFNNNLNLINRATTTEDEYHDMLNYFREKIEGIHLNWICGYNNNFIDLSKEEYRYELNPVQGEEVNNREAEVIDYRLQIENHSVEYFKNLHIGMLPEMIGRTVSFFEYSLSKEGLVDSDPDAEITHSEMLNVPVDWIINFNKLAVRIAHLYGTKHIEFKNHSEDLKYYFAFVGYKGEVHACYVSLKLLLNLYKECRQTFIDSRRKNMKPENKEKKADEYMTDWSEKLEESLCSTAFGEYDYDEINDYIAENFRTEDEFDALLKDASLFFELLYNAKENTIIENVIQKYKKKYKKDFTQIKERLDYLREQYLLTDWTWMCHDKYTPYGDKNSNYFKT